MHWASAFGETNGEPALVCEPAAINRDRFVAESPLPFARYQSFASVLAAAAVARLGSKLGDASRGVLALGGPVALDVAWQLMEKVKDGQPQYVNPIFFPASLISATATAIARITKSHAFAIAVGSDELAFYQAMETAGLLLHDEALEQVLVVAALDAGGVVRRSYAEVGRLRPKHVGLAFLIARSTSPAPAAAVSFEHLGAATRDRAFRLEAGLMSRPEWKCLGSAAGAVRTAEAISAGETIAWRGDWGSVSIQPARKS